MLICYFILVKCGVLPLLVGVLKLKPVVFDMMNIQGREP